MNKLKLEIDTLKVESFDAGGEVGAGTVRGLATVQSEWDCANTGDACFMAEGPDVPRTQKYGDWSCRNVCNSCSCQPTCETCSPVVCDPAEITMWSPCNTKPQPYPTS